MSSYFQMMPFVICHFDQAGSISRESENLKAHATAHKLTKTDKVHRDPTLFFISLSFSNFRKEEEGQMAMLVSRQFFLIADDEDQQSLSIICKSA